MLDNENYIQKYTSDCIKNLPFAFIVRPCDPGNGNIRVVMLEISENEEKELDAGKSLSLERGGLYFTVDPYLCFAYGEFDLSPNSNDVDKIDKANWFGRFTVRQFIPSEYDYETHTVTSDIKGGRWYDTDYVKTYIPYLYACLGKPKRICIFKEYRDIIAINRAKRKAETQREYSKNNKEYLRKKRQNRVAAKRNAKLNMLIFNVTK